MGTIGAMELPERDVATSWLGLPVEDAAGGRVGTCTAVYADDATDRPEWALVESAFDASLRMVPLVDAQEQAGSLRLSFAADLIETAPRMGNPDHLTQAEEAELYHHYGVPFSTGPSDSLLPNAAGEGTVESAPAAGAPALDLDEDRALGTATMPPLEPEPGPAPEPLVPSPMPEPLVPAPVPQPLQPTPAPEPPPTSPPSPPAPPAPAPAPSPAPPPPTVGSGSRASGVPAEGIVAGVAAVVTAAVLLLREARRSANSRSSARRVRAGRNALGGAASVVSGAAEALGSELARATGQLGEVTTDVARSGTRAITGAAESAKGVALHSAKGAAVQSRRQVRRSRRRMARSWRRTATRAMAVAGAGAGYVLGARAGERRYADIRSAANRLAERLRG